MTGRQVAVVVLAAGKSSRMGGPNKLLSTFDGVPLVRRTSERALASRAAPVIVVTGHDGEAVRSALLGLDIVPVENPTFAEGLSGSLRLGFARAAASGADGVLVLLADQPALTSDHLDRLIEAFRAAPEPEIVVATCGGALGNPVILLVGMAEAVERLTGDRGARRLLEDAHLLRVEIGPAALLDVNTPEALAAAGGRTAVPRRS